MTREILRDMLKAAGEQAALDMMRVAYEACRRPVILGGPPASDADQMRLWAARQALFGMDLHTRIWEIGRTVDYKLICERDKR